MLVGERFEFGCGGRCGYWHFNGSPTRQKGTTSEYSGTATIDLDGIFNCTDHNRTVEYSNFTFVVFGECGGYVKVFVHV